MECGLESAHLSDVMSSISVFVISNQLAHARLSLTSTGDASPVLADERLPGRSLQDSAAVPSVKETDSAYKGQFQETDSAYKGQFQTMLDKHAREKAPLKCETAHLGRRMFVMSSLVA